MTVHFVLMTVQSVLNVNTIPAQSISC